MVKQVDCTSCEFLLQDEDEDELIEFVQKHAEATHGMTMSRGDVRGWITEA